MLTKPLSIRSAFLPSVACSPPTLPAGNGVPSPNAPIPLPRRPPLLLPPLQRCAARVAIPPRRVVPVAALRTAHDIVSEPARRRNLRLLHAEDRPRRERHIRPDALQR